MNLGSAEDLAAMATRVPPISSPAREFPYLTEHVDQHLKPRQPDDEGEFAFGLDLILDGLERLRGAS